MAEDIKVLISKRQQALEKRRNPCEALWRDTAENIMPLWDDIFQEKQGGQRKQVKIYDSTPSYALNLYASGLHGYLVSPASVWFKYRIRPDWVNDLPEVRRWLDDCEEHTYGVFNSSNFYDKMFQHFLAHGSFGNAPFYMDEDEAKGQVMFDQWAPGEVYIMVDGWGEVDGFHRKKKYTRREIWYRFGFDRDADLPRNFEQDFKSDPFQEIELIHAVYPRMEFDRNKMNAKNKPWASVWYMPKDNHILKESGFDSLPLMYSQYLRDGRYEYAYGPASLALADIMTIHEMQKDVLLRGQYETMPAMNVPPGMEAGLDLGPKGVNIQSTPNEQITPIQLGGNFSLGLEVLQDKRRAIERHFHVDFFLMLAQQDAARGNKTATEVVELQGEKAIILGAGVASVQRNTLKPVIDKVFDIESRAGRMPTPPDLVFELQAKGVFNEIDIEYEGPLAQAQRRLFRAQGIMRGLEGAITFMEIDQSLRHEVNWSETFREYLEANNWPAKALHSKEEAAELRDEEARQLQQQQAMENLPMQAKAAKDLKDIPVGGDALAELAAQQAGGVSGQA